MKLNQNIKNQRGLSERSECMSSCFSQVFFKKLGETRAYVQFKPETPAIDVATQLGLM